MWRDLRYAIRMLGQSPGFTGAAVVALALGIGATTAIFSVVNAVLLRPLPYPDPGRLVLVKEHNQGVPVGTTSFATYADWEARGQTLERVAAIRSWYPTLTGQGEPERLQAMRVSASFFGLLGVAPQLGRDFLETEDRPDAWRAIVLSQGLWRRRFGGDPQVIGRRVALSGESFTVVGVMPAEFEEALSANFYEPAELWAPLGYGAALPYACRTCRHLRVVARLKPGVTLEQAGAEVDAITRGLAREHPQDYAGAGATLLPLQEQFVSSIRPALYLMLGAVGVVLLVACANLANLLLARAARRRREMAVRAALGAGRARLLRQLLTESLLLAVVGAGGGLLLVVWGLDALVALAPSDLPSVVGAQLDTRVLLFTLGLTVLTGLVFGLAPALHASRVDLQSALRDEGRGTTGGGPGRLRGLLVSGELALSLVLLIGAGLLVRSFVRLSQVSPGFDARGLLTMQVSALGPRYEDEARVRAFYEEVLRRVAGLPGVESAAMVSNLPLGGNRDQAGLHVEGRPLANAAEAPSPERYGVSPDYLRAMRIPLRRGRILSERDGPDAPRVALIGESVARRVFAGEDPLGKSIRLGGPDSPTRTIVGVVGDVSHDGLEVAPDLQIYVPHAQWSVPYMQLVIRAAGDPAALAGAVRRELWAVDPDQPVYRVATMEQLISATVARRRFLTLLLNLFAGVALVMATIGTYGLISYTVAQRAPEFGLRVALGAQPGDIYRLVLRQGARLALAGVGAGLAIALALARVLASLLYGVSATDPLIFGAISLLLLSVALIASYVPARRAAKVDPVVALRQE